MQMGAVWYECMAAMFSFLCNCFKLRKVMKDGGNKSYAACKG